MKKTENGFADLFKWAKNQKEYWVEGAKIEFAEQMLAQMEAQNISRTALATRLGTSPAYVTKILRGSTNFTLESMVSIARALNCELCTHLQKQGSKGIWVEFNFTSGRANSFQYWTSNQGQENNPAQWLLNENSMCGVA